MGPARMLRSLQSSIQAVFPDFHGHQIKGLATTTDAMVRAEHCQLSRMGVATLGRARPPSSERRFQRLIANPRMDPRQIIDTRAASSLANVNQVTLLLDETPRDDSLDAMKLCRQVGGRAIPLLWECYPSKKSPEGQVPMVMDMLDRADRALPNPAQPTLLADRGFGWPGIVDFCRERGWHFVLHI